MFGRDVLLRLCPHAAPDIVAAIAPVLEARRAEFGITTALRGAHFIAQVAHESAGFTRLSENLDYSAPRIVAVWPRLASRAGELEHHPEKLANAAYADR